jgi:hypothetical protein
VDPTAAGPTTRQIALIIVRTLAGLFRFGAGPARLSVPYDDLADQQAPRRRAARLFGESTP